MNIRKIRTSLYAVTGLVAALVVSTSASAYEPYEYFERHGYEDELQRCVESLRPVLDVSDGDQVSYIVDEIDLRGPWYRFEIAATLVNKDGDTELDNFRIGCKSNRWIAEVRLIERDNIQTLQVEGTEVLAKNP